jgi:ABC-type uncharacterized transport system ATPase subunit
VELASEAQPGTVLRVSSITKWYGSNKVLDDVNFSLKYGEIHALLGENGAGKTTLMNILRGLTQQSAGAIFVDGKQATIKSPVASAKLGIGMVHQHFLLVPAFTVEENLVLAGQHSGLLVNRKQTISEADAICTKLGWTVPYQSRVADLTVGIQQRVEILKALLGDAKILLLDEPTAVLTPLEVDELLNVFRTLRDEGRSLVFVSHKLGEVMAVCDRVTVLRRGRVVGEAMISETNPEDLARRMVGEEANSIADDSPAEAPVQRGDGLVVRALNAPQQTVDDVALTDLNFEVGNFEILGFAGVDGNGQEELFETLSGMRDFSPGEMRIGGAPRTKLDPAELNGLGISLIPPDRQRQGLALSLSIRDNLLFDAVRDPKNQWLGFLANRQLTALAQRLRAEYDIRTSDLSLPASSLSGGNQQKIVIARALSKSPKIVIAASPTRGLDVAATAYVHDKLRQCRDAGAAIVLISTELDEVIALSNRIAVLYEGRIAAIVPPTTPREQIGLLMGGKSVEQSMN